MLMFTCAPAGSGGQPAYASVVSLDSKWMPGQFSITRMGSLAAYLGPSKSTGQVVAGSHMLSQSCQISFEGALKNACLLFHLCCLQPRIIKLSMLPVQCVHEWDNL